MLTTPANVPARTRSIFKNPLLYTSIVTVIALLVVAWIFFSRWLDNRQIEARQREERTQKQLENDRTAAAQFGGKELAIQSFYANPGAIRRGQVVQLCYGVANAKEVKLEPQPNAVWPSYSRCVEVSPSRSTTYTLTATDAAGNSKTESLDVKVQ
jgi:hypothetical protein